MCKKRKKKKKQAWSETSSGKWWVLQQQNRHESARRNWFPAFFLSNKKNLSIKRPIQYLRRKKCIHHRALPTSHRVPLCVHIGLFCVYQIGDIAAVCRRIFLAVIRIDLAGDGDLSFLSSYLWHDMVCSSHRAAQIIRHAFYGGRVSPEARCTHWQLGHVWASGAICFPPTLVRKEERAVFRIGEQHRQAYLN